MDMKLFEALAREARREHPPVIDVSRQVIYRISALEEEIDRPLAWLTAGSMALAGVAGAFAFTLYGTIADPLGTLFQISPMLGH